MREWVLSQRIDTGKGVFMIRNVISACFSSDVTSISSSRFTGGDIKEVIGRCSQTNSIHDKINKSNTSKAGWSQSILAPPCLFCPPDIWRFYFECYRK